ncbi:MAG: cupin domain-containing protein [Acidobacteriota bacterium]|nr:cupin domain-containing protein [Acidobacteriota bacterium]
MKGKKLSKGLMIAISVGIVLLGVTAYKGVAAKGGTVSATQASGVTVTPLAPVAQLDRIHSKAKSGGWMAQINTKGVSDLHFVQVTIQPGGTIGWHTHLGPSFLIVKSGTATLYDGDDPTCTPQVLPAGSGLFEPGGDLHIVRNEGTEPLVNVVMQLLPTGAPRLIPEPSPGNCPF